jgi:hypothetical protein
VKIIGKYTCTQKIKEKVCGKPAIGYSRYSEYEGGGRAYMCAEHANSIPWLPPVIFFKDKEL